MTTPLSSPIDPPPVQNGDKTLAVFCHLSLLLGVGFLLPLIVYFVKGTESPFVGTHAKEVLNFHISLLIYGLCTIPLVFLLVGIPVFIGLGITAFICAIIGAIRASEGGFYFYPLTIRFIG
jgi:uncharacterized protein